MSHRDHVSCAVLSGQFAIARGRPFQSAFSTFARRLTTIDEEVVMGVDGCDSIDLGEFSDEEVVPPIVLPADDRDTVGVPCEEMMDVEDIERLFMGMDVDESMHGKRRATGAPEDILLLCSCGHFEMIFSL